MKRKKPSGVALRGRWLFCPCGKKFYCIPSRLKRTRCCSKACQYKYARRPNGLNYNIKVKNKGWFEKGHIPNPKVIDAAKARTGKPCLWMRGKRNSPATEFKKGQIPRNYKGDEVGYHALHAWVRRHFGDPVYCEMCSTNKQLCWASKNWRYTRAREDWWMLCMACNSKYDLENNWGAATEKFPESRRYKCVAA